jgi:uncharacterized membrane protein
VSEAGTPYQIGGCAELGCSSPEGTFGVRDLGSRVRVVWHYRAFSEQRTFTINYQMIGLAKAYDDIVDVEFQVWGGEWEVPVQRVTATLSLPSGLSEGDVLIWGHPRTVDGTVSLGDDGISPSLQTGRVPAGQFVEIRVLIPRSTLTSTASATVIDGSGLDDIVAEENRDARVEQLRSRAIAILTFIGVLALFLPATLATAIIFWRYGREPRVAYDREYEQEPPSDDPPAMIQSLLTQGAVDEHGFTATVFDLIRRGVLKAQPTSVDRRTWMGLRTETITDLELSLGDTGQPLKEHERSVVTVMQRILSEGPQPLHVFRDRIRDDAAANASTYASFKTEANRAVVSAKLLDRSATTVLTLTAIGLAIVFGLLIAIGGWIVGTPARGGGVIPLFIGGAVLNTIIFAIFVALRKTWVKRTPEGALLAARWQAFRSYLRDFSRLEEAPPIALDLWDKFLVYAIALGVAEEVLAAARLHAPQELETASSVYWYGTHGFTGARQRMPSPASPAH